MKIWVERTVEEMYPWYETSRKKREGLRQVTLNDEDMILRQRYKLAWDVIGQYQSILEQKWGECED